MGAALGGLWPGEVVDTRTGVCAASVVQAWLRVMHGRNGRHSSVIGPCSVKLYNRDGYTFHGETCVPLSQRNCHDINAKRTRLVEHLYRHFVCALCGMEMLLRGRRERGIILQGLRDFFSVINIFL